LAVNYSPSISTSAMLVYYDALNPKCYPGSGTTVYDLSGNARNGTFGGTVGPTWNSSGWFNFTGGVVATNYSRISLSLPTMANGITTEIWFRHSSYGTPYRMVSSDLGFSIFSSYGSIYAGLNYDDYVRTFTTPAVNTWFCFSMTWDNQNMVVYRNGASITSGSRSTALTDIAAGTLYLGTRNDLYSDHLVGDIAIFKMYDRVLSQNEVKQNFHAIRNRFGL